MSSSSLPQTGTMASFSLNEFVELLLRISFQTFEEFFDKIVKVGVLILQFPFLVVSVCSFLLFYY